MNRTRKSGEIATLLTLATMAVIAVGLFIGTRIQQREAGPAYVPPQAQEQGQEPTEAPLRGQIATSASYQTPQVCYPITNNSAQSYNDQWCNVHIEPLDSENPKNPEIIFNNQNNPTSFNIRGTVCLNSERGPQTLQNLIDRKAEIYVSNRSRYETIEGDNPQVISNNAVGLLYSAEAIKGRPYQGEGGDGQLDMYMKINRNVNYSDVTSKICAFKPAPDKNEILSWEDRNNLLVFNVKSIQIGRILEGILDNFNDYYNNQSGTPPAYLNADNICSMFIHYKSDNAGFEAFNVTGLDIEEILGGSINETNESDCVNAYSGSLPAGCYSMRNPRTNQIEQHTTAKWIEILCSPVTTPTVTSTPINSPTPSPTATPAPPARCFEDCKVSLGSCENTLMSGDPVDESIRPVTCMEVIIGSEIVQGAMSPTPTPRPNRSGSSTESETPETDSGSDSQSPDGTIGTQREIKPGVNVIGPCNSSTSKTCRCVKSSCAPRTNVNGTKTSGEPCYTERQACYPVPTSTPTRTPTPTNTPTATPTQTPTPTPFHACNISLLGYVNVCDNYNYGSGTCNTELKDRPPLHTSGTAANGEYTVKDPSKWNMTYDRESIKRTFSSCVASAIGRYACVQNTVSSRVETPQEPSENGIPVLPPYETGNVAMATLEYDRSEYAIIPRGGSYVEICANSESDITNACLSTSGPDEDMPSSNVIGDLNVKCGNDIRFGWTLLPCKANVDYVFVIDKSSSMSLNVGGTTKMQVAKDALKKYITEVKNNETDSRIAVVPFGRDVDTSYGISETLTPIAEFNINKIDSIQPYNPETQNGTCIHCGLNKAQQIIEKHSVGNTVYRKPVVILLTDGLPDMCWETNGVVNGECGNQEALAAAAAVRLKDTGGNGNVILAGIGFGDLNATEQNGQWDNRKQLITKIKEWASVEGDFTWVYSTDAEVATGIADVTVGDLGEVMQNIMSKFDQCSLALAAYAKTLKAVDVNGDGVINSMDYFIVIDNYRKEGENLEGDINKDKIVNSLDLTLVIQNFGTVIDE